MKKRLLDILTNALESLREKILRDQTIVPKSGEGFTWISAEEQAGETDDADENKEPLPMFRKGDELHIFEPHTGALFVDEESIGPELYTVMDVMYDDESDNEDYHVFRYKLDGWDDWISEDWLSLPFYSKFKKEMVVVPKEIPSMNDKKVEAMLRRLDEGAKRREVDRLLDVMNSGTVEEKDEARRRLAEIATK